ncbi:MAG TPA: DUF4406 domain-containing protein [Phnomibacter sp.]|nr:DUF4406 domain-containing protein [Phnomibacter sp.]
MGNSPHTIYIAGKVTGLPLNEVHVKFTKAAQDIQALGHNALNPYAFVLDAWPLNDINSGLVSWHAIMRLCIAKLATATGVLVLPCWPSSRGATLERFIAGSLGIPIYNSLAQLQQGLQQPL